MKKKKKDKIVKRSPEEEAVLPREGLQGKTRDWAR
jgi:hypothetical protein